MARNTYYHVKNLGSGWITDHGNTGGVMKSLFLCVLIKIGTIDPTRATQLDSIMRSYDGRLTSIPNINCGNWLFTVLEELVQQSLVHCTDIQGLRDECLAFGNEHMITARDNEQPRPVVTSTMCS